MGYHGLGHHYGYYGRKKREATAEADADASPEADPWLLYGGYYGHGLAYGGYYGYGYHHAPYAYLGGCCMEATMVTDLPMEDITVTDTTMRHMPTLVAAVITSVVLSPALADKKERCQQKIKIDSWNHFFVS